MVAAHGLIFKLGSGYDELMRIPFILRYPRVVRPDTRCDALVQNIDVLPTLLDLCGLKAPAGIDGRSFRALLEGKAKEFRDQVMTVMANTIMLATRDWKLVYSCGRDSKPFVELYDRHQHPLEVKNLAGDAARADVLADIERRLVKQLHETGYPYADVVEQRMAKARTKMPTSAEMVVPSVASCKPVRDDKGKLFAEFTIEWNVGQPLQAEGETTPAKYWTFVQVLGPGGRTIVTRATLWPEPPTTTWKAGTKQTVGPLRVPILGNMQGSYPVRVGLYRPETKSRPPVDGEGQRTVGTLTVGKEANAQTITFRAEK